MCKIQIHYRFILNHNEGAHFSVIMEYWDNRHIFKIFCVLFPEQEKIHN